LRVSGDGIATATKTEIPSNLTNCGHFFGRDRLPAYRPPHPPRQTTPSPIRGIAYGARLYDFYARTTKATARFRMRSGVMTTATGVAAPVAAAAARAPHSTHASSDPIPREDSFLITVQLVVFVQSMAKMFKQPSASPLHFRACSPSRSRRSFALGRTGRHYTLV
jgi:hypothetical protein